jgi:hypothetical protein
MKAEGKIRSSRFAPLAQAGLAALVAGSLLTFSTLAFNTAFDEDPARRIAVAGTETAAPRPVVLAASAPETRSTDARKIADVLDEEDIVLGKRIARAVDNARPAPSGPKAPSPPAPVAPTEDTHERDKGNGHEKARGNGHHKDHDRDWRDDDEDVDHADERDDDDHSDDSHDSDSASSSGGDGGSRSGGSRG